MLQQNHYLKSVYETPFHERTSELNILNDWTRWKDYTVPNSYFRVDLEYFAARNSTAVFDYTPMIKQRIRGKDALEFVERFFTRNMEKIGLHRVGYAVWCDEQGQVIDDGTVFHMRENEYWLLCAERQLDNLEVSAVGFDVEIDELTDDIAALGVQGPTSASILKAMGFEGIEMLKPFDIKHYPYQGEEISISRTGFTGDLDVIPCLMCVSTIEALIKARVSSGIRKVINRDVFIESSDKITSSSRISGSNSKIINLSTNEEILIIEFSGVNTTFMSGVSDIKFIM